MAEQRADTVAATLRDTTSSQRVRLACASLLAAAGLAAVAVPLVQARGSSMTGPTVLLGIVIPVLAGLAVLAGGVWVGTSDLGAHLSVTVTIWWFLGTAVGAFSALGLIAYQAVAGGRPVGVAVTVSGMASVGGIGGLMVGRYDARSQRRRAELERERSQLADEREKLALLNRIVRHDIGNDLQIIAGVTDHLESHVDETGRDHLERAQRTTEEAIQLTEQVRAFVASLGEDGASERRRLSLARVLETQIENTREVYREATVAVDGEIPPVAVYADELLATVFHNLLTNAVEHNDREEPFVEVAVEYSDETVAVEIRDDGPGIPSEGRERVHDIEAGDGAQTDTGLGLYIVGMLVDRYDGTVTISDREPRGTVVTVTLPIAEGT